MVGVRVRVTVRLLTMHVVATPSLGFLTQLRATALPKLLGLPVSSSISVCVCVCV